MVPGQPHDDPRPGWAVDDVLREPAWLRTALGSVADGIIATDAAGRITFMNATAERLTGWPLQDARGRPLPEVFRILDEETRLSVAAPALQALAEGLGVGLSDRTILVARDGTERRIEDSAAPVRDDDGITVDAVLVFRDVGERLGAEEAQARLAAIVASSEDAIVSKTLQGVIRTWNGGAEHLFGYTAEEAIGKSITLIIPPERLREEREILARLCRGERIEHFETVRVTKDGRRIDVSLSVSPVRDRHGRIVGASKIARDVTLQKRAEETLRLADRRKDEFLATLAHELRNPLATFRNGLEVMRLAENDRGAVTKAREMMERQLGHVARLVDDLLDVSRIGRNKLELRRRRVLLTDVISSAVETVRPAVEAAGHELRVSLPSDPVCLEADLTRLAQVFGNLLTNSVKYTPQGGVISLSVAREEGHVTVAVQDNGIGIPATALGSIFDMYSQVRRNRARAGGGLGIGLALVKRLVELHGGTVSVESAGEDRGSTFTVRLPCLAPRSDTPAADRRSASIVVGPRRVLVVDDSVDSALSMATMLRLLGNSVRTAHDGVEAVAVAEQFRPDVVLMDVTMPRVDGLEAARRIRAEPWGGAIAIIALTGRGMEGDREASRAAGCSGHLVKPVRLQDIEELLAGSKPPSAPAPGPREVPA